MYGRYGIYYGTPHARQTQQAGASRQNDEIKRSDVAFQYSDDLWIFLRLVGVMAVFCAALACIVWVAS